MNSTIFWDVIARTHSRERDYDADIHGEAIAQAMSTWSTEQLLSFELILRQEIQRLDTPEVAELYRMVFSEEDYISDDGFLYFRCWILLQGRAFTEAILSDINALAHLNYSHQSIWGGEALLTATDDATGEEIRDEAYIRHPELDYDTHSAQYNRPLRSRAELAAQLPELSAFLAQQELL